MRADNGAAPRQEVDGNVTIGGEVEDQLLSIDDVIQCEARGL